MDRRVFIGTSLASLGIFGLAEATEDDGIDRPKFDLKQIGVTVKTRQFVHKGLEVTESIYDLQPVSRGYKLVWCCSKPPKNSTPYDLDGKTVYLMPLVHTDFDHPSEEREARKRVEEKFEAHWL